MNDKERIKIASNNLKITTELYDNFENDLNSLESITDMARINIAIATAFNYANSKGIGSKMIKVIVDEMFELLPAFEEEIEEECASVGSEEDIEVLNELIKTLQTIVEREEK